MVRFMVMLTALALALAPFGSAFATVSKGKATGGTKSAVANCHYKRCR